MKGSKIKVFLGCSIGCAISLFVNIGVTQLPSAEGKAGRTRQRSLDNCDVVIGILGEICSVSVLECFAEVSFFKCRTLVVTHLLPQEGNK